MSQNRAAAISEKRSHLDLQFNLLSEQENTKMLLMLEQIGQGGRRRTPSDPEVQVLEQATQPEALSRQIDQATDEGGAVAGGSGGWLRSRGVPR